jgi:hypothetical protein
MLLQRRWNAALHNTNCCMLLLRLCQHHPFELMPVRLQWLPVQCCSPACHRTWKVSLVQCCHAASCKTPAQHKSSISSSGGTSASCASIPTYLAHWLCTFPYLHALGTIHAPHQYMARSQQGSWKEITLILPLSINVIDYFHVQVTNAQAKNRALQDVVCLRSPLNPTLCPHPKALTMHPSLLCAAAAFPQANPPSRPSIHLSRSQATPPPLQYFPS